MRNIIRLLLGFMLGAAVGATLVALFSPVSGQEITANLKRGWAETMEAARQASEQRRAELEAQLAEMRTVRQEK